MKKLMFVLLAAIMFASMFVGVRQAKAASEAMIWNPVYKVVDPPMDGSDLTFLWPINISTATAVSAWEAKILWDPAVLTIETLDNIFWGTFMTGADINNASAYIGKNQLVLGQNFQTQNTVSGDGLLATIKFTFVLPGFTTVYFLEASVWDDTLVETSLLSPFGTTQNGQLKSNRPHPAFYWRTDDGLNPLPTHTDYCGGRTTTTGTTVHFYGNLSYDVCNVGWNGSAWVPLPGFPDIVRYLWEWGDGTSTDGAAYAVDHVFPAYKKEGYWVNLTVWDSEGDWWSSTWRYQGSAPTDNVPMWRDIAIVDIWPSLPPYQNWEEYGDDWGNYWFFDSTDFWLAQTNDNYWNYLVDFPSYGYPAGETVKTAWQNYGSEGLYVLVTANNFGSVREKVTVNCYALYLDLNIRMAPPPPSASRDVSVERIGTWSGVLNPGAGSGWGYYTVWMPPKNGSYLLFATIEAADSTAVHDGDSTNDYMLLNPPVCNIATWDSVNLVLRTNPIYVAYKCDIEGNGKIGPEDFALLSSNYGAKPPK